MTISDSLSSRTLTDASLATLATKPSTGGLVDSEPANFQNIWSQILQDVQDSTKTTPPKTLILLGDNESGRSTLISRLKGVETIRKGIGLEYNYIDIKDDDRDDVPKLSVWTPDGDGACTNLLKFALNESNFENTLIAFVVSMHSPWAIMDSLKKWSNILTEHVSKLNIGETRRQEYAKRVYRMFQLYQDPEEAAAAAAASSGKKRSKDAKKAADSTSTTNTESEIDDSQLVPLDPTILSKNLGLPIMVIVTKSDSISILDKEMEYRLEHFDFIQYHIRRFALQYGASLFYTTIKDKRTFERLHKYILHKLYDYPFGMSSNVVDRESIFIPSGWDNEGKMNILLENSATIKSDSEYSEIIQRPTTMRSRVAPRGGDVETVQASEDQDFLAKLQVVLNKSVSTTKTEEMSTMTSMNTTTSTPPSLKTPHKPPIHKGPASTGTDSTNLKNFFQNLLNKNAPTTPVSASTSPSTSLNATPTTDSATNNESNA